MPSSSCSPRAGRPTCSDRVPPRVSMASCSWGPQCPVQRSGNDCPDLPHQAWIKVRGSGGGSVTRIRSGADGRFRLGLRPGRYVLDPESGSPFPTASEQEVVVEDGVYAEVIVSFDTGIR